MFIKATQSEPTYGYYPEMSFWRVLYPSGRIIGHFTVHRMVGYILSGIGGLSCELLRYQRDGPWPMAYQSPCDNERTVAWWTNALRAYAGKDSERIPPGPWSRESVQYVHAYTR